VTILKILLVEDNLRWQKILRDDLRDALDKAGYCGDIRVVGTYDEAHDELKENPWNLLITDIGLGNPSESLQKLGIHLAQLAYAQEIPAIAVSGTPHLIPHDIRRLFKRAGASDFFSKQHFDDTEFIETVQAILHDANKKIIQPNPLGTLIKTILILAAHPKNSSRQLLDQEVRDIVEGLQRAQKRDQFILKQQWAVRPRDIQRAMLDTNPQIVHFSGHGIDEAGLFFEDELEQPKWVSSSALAGLFKLFETQIECVVLNGCYSDAQAQAIAQHIPYVIGISQTLSEWVAIEFIVSFYDALEAGRSIEFAYRWGCSIIQLSGSTEDSMPVLLKRHNLRE
jgi:CheY-like chemotaxis protein